MNEIQKELISLSQEKYQKFASALIPNVDNLLGVRIPVIHKIAKRIAKDDAFLYLQTATDLYFEETMLQGLVICNMKEDLDIILKQIKLFVPKINNWSVCDSFCTHLKVVKANKNEFWDFLQTYISSNNAYDIRFAVVIMLFYYIEENYLDQLFSAFNKINHQDYYVKMSVAWAVSMCFVKYPDETMAYLKNNNLDNFTYNKSLQKIRESLKVDKDTKEIIKSMKKANL